MCLTKLKLINKKGLRMIAVAFHSGKTTVYFPVTHRRVSSKILIRCLLSYLAQKPVNNICFPFFTIHPAALSYSIRVHLLFHLCISQTSILFLPKWSHFTSLTPSHHQRVANNESDWPLDIISVIVWNQCDKRDIVE